MYDSCECRAGPGGQASVLDAGPSSQSGEQLLSGCDRRAAPRQQLPRGYAPPSISHCFLGTPDGSERGGARRAARRAGRQVSREASKQAGGQTSKASQPGPKGEASTYPLPDLNCWHPPLFCSPIRPLLPTTHPVCPPDRPPSLQAATQRMQHILISSMAPGSAGPPQAGSVTHPPERSPRAFTPHARHHLYPITTTSTSFPTYHASPYPTTTTTTTTSTSTSTSTSTTTTTTTTAQEPPTRVDPVCAFMTKRRARVTHDPSVVGAQGRAREELWGAPGCPPYSPRSLVGPSDPFQAWR
ncbi:hypothetical protein E2C01_018356 [Portunus trituberculatus]|uniref:Uncharacterized protein n=1 Tax=Portunus trituberculatus TaxID=210409 RepID=A0A5B7DUU1_PORTR|nr:hypothetical protein [Portunus trituberculatus]